ncbi:MAG: methyltransferase domain-containing protein [Alphaproteobacteria bacterium]
MRWDPAQYLAFADHRARPALELLARVAHPAPAQVYDLGCGTGAMVKMMHERWPEAEVTGVDRSADMLATAREAAPGAAFEAADLADWAPAAPADVIYSNAALHWLDGHDHLFPRLFGHLAPGGVLAVQMPRNFQQPSHALMREVADSPAWTTKLAGVLQTDPVAAPEVYYDLLAALGAGLDIWQVEYLQLLDGEDAVLNWVRGTALRPVLAALDDGDGAAFEAEYGARLRQAYPVAAGGRTPFPFRRLFIVATRPA